MLCRSVSLKYREWKRPCFFTVLQCLVTQSCPALRNPVDCSPPGSSVHRDSPGQNAGVGCHALLQGIFPAQESNPGLLHWGGFFASWATREARVPSQLESNHSALTPERPSLIPQSLLPLVTARSTPKFAVCDLLRGNLKNVPSFLLMKDNTKSADFHKSSLKQLLQSCCTRWDLLLIPATSPRVVWSCPWTCRGSGPWATARHGQGISSALSHAGHPLKVGSACETPRFLTPGSLGPREQPPRRADERRAEVGQCGVPLTLTLTRAAPGAAAPKSLQSCPTLWPHRLQPTRLPHPWDSPGKNTGVGCHFLLQCMKVKSESEVARSCPTLRDPMDCSLPGSSIHGIFQARVLEWCAIAFSGSGCRKSLLCAGDVSQQRSHHCGWNDWR